MAPADSPVDYTYLTLPPDEDMRSCVGLVVAGLAARARIGAAALEEAVKLLQDQHDAVGGPTRYRFSLREGGLLAEVEEGGSKVAEGRTDGEAAEWRTVVELVS